MSLVQPAWSLPAWSPPSVGPWWVGCHLIPSSESLRPGEGGQEGNVGGGGHPPHSRAISCSRPLRLSWTPQPSVPSTSSPLGPRASRTVLAGGDVKVGQVWAWPSKGDCQ